MRVPVIVLCLAIAGCSASGKEAVVSDDGRGGSAAGSQTGGAPPLVTGGAAPTGTAGTLHIPIPVGDPMAPDAETCDGKLTAVVRDFQPSHPDFEFLVPGTDGACHCSEKGIVGEMLSADGKPVYVGATGKTTSTAMSFDQWYRDTPGVNQRSEVVLQFTETAKGTYAYDSAPPNAPMGMVATKEYPGFFPIDGQLFGNSGNDDWGQPHNYHFTLELVSAFVYQPGDIFSFRGDDDVWVFIDGRRVIDLGGIHVPESATVELDTLGLTPGETYPLHFFFAERHVTGSNFLMETNLRFIDCDAPK